MKVSTKRQDNASILSRGGQKGFTLVEILISLVCMLIVMGTIYQVYFQQDRLTRSEEGIINMQLNARIGMERLTTLFGHAGFGSRDSFLDGQTMSGNDPDTGSVTIDSYLWDIQNKDTNSSDSDSVVVVYGYKQVTSVDGSFTENDFIECQKDPSPQIEDSGGNFKNYLAIFPDVQGNFFYECTQIESLASYRERYTLISNIYHVKDDASVYMVAPVRVKVKDNVLYFQNFVYNNSIFWEIADNIQKLHIQYTEDGETWQDEPDNPNKVLGVQVWLLVKSDIRDIGFTDTRTYTLAGQTVGPYQDSYHRKLARTLLWVHSAR